jgi:ATP-dependent exoDNAse (exonuclease V) beta subunit
MSIHAAKGLEFPVVVIGDAGKAPRGRNGILVDADWGVVPPLKAEGEPGAAPATSLVYALAQQAEKDQAAAESDRLLYVAATRAQELLILSGTANVRKNGSLGLAGWLDQLDSVLHLSDAAPVCDAEGEMVHAMTLHAEGQPVAGPLACVLYAGNAEVVARAALGKQRPAPGFPETLPLLESLTPVPAQTDADTAAAQRDPPRRVWRVVPEWARPTAPAWVVGQLVHRALEGWLFPDDKTFGPWAEAEARGCGITDAAELHDAVRRARRILTRFQTTDLYAKMDTASRRLHEVPYSLVDADGVVERGTFDALFRADGAWTLVEFKTDYVKNHAALEEILAHEDYVAQVARYLEAAARLLGTRPRPVLCFLNYAGAMHVVGEWAIA